MAYKPHLADHLGDSQVCRAPVYMKLNLLSPINQSCVLNHAVLSDWLFATPWTVAHQAPLSMGFYRQGYWSGLPFPSSGDLPNPGIKLRPPAL